MIEHLLQRLKTVQLQKHPFSYFFAEQIFPADFYEELLEHIPKEPDYQPLSNLGIVRQGTYQERHCLSLETDTLSQFPFPQMIFWSRFAEILKSPIVISAILQLFQEEPKGNLYPDLGLISDRSGYAIGPHTDHPQKILTLLFYFPPNQEQKGLGTSVYEPIDPTFRCEGFKHHSFDGFKKVYTAPFLPNSVFGFFKSDRSFHGVEKIGEQKSARNLLSYQLLTTDE